MYLHSEGRDSANFKGSAERFFAEQKCLDCLNFEPDKLYEIQEAFRTLPDTVLHRWIHSDAAFDADYLVSDGPVNPKTNAPYGRNTKAFDAWNAEQTLEIISGKEFNFLVTLQKSVWLHELAAELLTDGVAEGTVRTAYCGEMCQIRMDFFNEKFGIIDLKTCDDLTWFEADCKRYGYIHQLAFYRAVLREAGRVRHPVHVIAVEKREPFRCGVWRISDEALDFAESENAAAIRRLQKCRETGVFPTGYESIRIIDNL